MDKENIKKQIAEYSSEAKKYDELKDYQKAFDFYLKAANHLQLLKNEEQNESIKNEYIKQAKEYAIRAKEIRDNIIPRKATIEFLNKNLEENKKINVKWEDVAGLDKAKSIFKELVISPLIYPKLYQGKQAPLKTILLYGHSGTGKSHFVKAVATELQKLKGNFFSISSYGNLQRDRFFEDLINFAIKKKPALIFVDDLTYFLNKDIFYQNLYTQFFNLFHQIEKNEGIILIGAVNFPWELDTTFLSKFQKKIYFPPPNFEVKKAIIKMNLKDTPNTLTEEQIEDIIEKTTHLNGCGIASLPQEAMFYPLSKCQESEYFKKIPGINGQKFNYVPCTENEPGAIKMKMNEIPKEEMHLLLPPKVEYQDLINAYRSQKINFNHHFIEEVKKLEEFTKKFGEEG